MRGWPNYTAEPEAEARLGIQSSSPPQEKGEAQGETKLLSLDSERGSSTDPEKSQAGKLHLDASDTHAKAPQFANKVTGTRCIHRERCGNYNAVSSHQAAKNGGSSKLPAHTLFFLGPPIGRQIFFIEELFGQH